MRYPLLLVALQGPQINLWSPIILECSDILGKNIAKGNSAAQM
jgi:hypothetical protein